MNAMNAAMNSLSDGQIREILAEQREAFLRRGSGIERIALNEVGKKIRLPHVIVITGLRRSGKSTLLRQIVQRYYPKGDFYYVNFEDERLLKFPASEFNRLYEALVGLFGKNKTFLIDEIQNVAGFESFVRRFSDEGFKFFITGSSANLLSRELGTKLAGRHVDVVVRPFSFAEFLMLKGLGAASLSPPYKTEIRAEIKKRFDEYLTTGGMPEYAIHGDPEIISRIYEDTVLKDIAIRYRIENVALLRELYQYLITNFAKRFSFNSLKAITGVGSVNTIKRYISYVEETYFAKSVSKFDYSLKKRIMNDKKLYFADNGFIRAVSKKMTKDMGMLLENLVFNSLDSQCDVFYYYGKRECDFLLAKNRRVMRAFQVCWELSDENRGREIGGLLEALNEFGLKEGVILTHGQEREIKSGGKKIVVLPVWKWLLSRRVVE